MREIKFRAWDKKRKVMMGEDYPDANYGGWADDVYCVWKQEIIEGINSFNDKDTILMQFTGLKDKNSKEIYESDIIRMGSSNYEVKFGLHVIEVEQPKYEDEQADYFRAYGFYAKSDDYTTSIEEVASNSELAKGLRDPCEIIGNKYENKDLIKK